MTDIGSSQPAIQAFELRRTRSGKGDRVAEFEVRAKSPLRKLQHFLHANPTAVPAIVLLLGVAAFGLIVGSRFLSSFNLSLIIQQVTIIGVIGVGPDADRDHRRHRSVGRRHHGAVLGDHGQACGHGRAARSARAPGRHRGRRQAAARSTACW